MALDIAIGSSDGTLKPASASATGSLRVLQEKIIGRPAARYSNNLFGLIPYLNTSKSLKWKIKPSASAASVGTRFFGTGSSKRTELSPSSKARRIRAGFSGPSPTSLHKIFLDAGSRSSSTAASSKVKSPLDGPWAPKYIKVKGLGSGRIPVAEKSLKSTPFGR